MQPTDKKKQKMKKFKQKVYTIQEGHYTGPKDLEKIPGSLEVVGKSVLGGTAVGGVVGGVLKEAGVDGSSISEGMATGGKTGFFAGIAAKYLLNALHKPMKTVKFQDVDKLIRAKFGIYRVSGFTAGDSLQKRKTVEEKFGFNDRNVTAYKISFCIQDNKVTMYTLGITEDDLDKLNSSLDYYCKKFFGMSYSSKPISLQTNSYSVSITFTNYKAISDFILEVSEVLGYKINLLNESALIERETTEKTFSSLDKYDKLKILANAGGNALGAFVAGPKAGWSTLVARLISNTLETLSRQEIAKYFPAYRKDLCLPYLEHRLQKKLGFIEGVHYTKGLENRECNIRLDQGLFIVTALIGSKAFLALDKILDEKDKKEVKGKVAVWTFYVEDRASFDKILTKIITAQVNPNIFIP